MLLRDTDRNPALQLRESHVANAIYFLLIVSTLLIWIEPSFNATSRVNKWWKSERLYAILPILSARMLARKAKEKEAQESDDAELPHTEERVVQITLWNMLKPVQLIIQERGIDSIPEQIIGDLRSILVLRNQCRNWFRSNTSQHDQETLHKNAQHVYLIECLKLDPSTEACCSGSQFTSEIHKPCGPS